MDLFKFIFIDQVIAIEDNLDKYLNRKSSESDCGLYSGEGAEFKILKELFAKLITWEKSFQVPKKKCFGIIEILCHCSGEELSHLVNFLTMRKLQKKVRQSIISINE